MRRGDPVDEISRLAAESAAAQVFAEEDYSPYAVKRDEAVARRVNLRLVHGLWVHHPAAFARADGKPYTVFTPFSRAWKALPFNGHVLPAPDSLPQLPELPSVAIPAAQYQSIFPASEREAMRWLEQFLTGPLSAYADAHTGRSQSPGRFWNFFTFTFSALRTAFSAQCSGSRVTGH